MDELKELQINIIYEISRILSQAQNLEQALEFIFKALAQSLSLKSAGVTLKDERGQLYCRVFRDFAPKNQPRAGGRPGEGINGLVLGIAQPFLMPVSGQEPIFLNQARARQFPKKQVAFIGVPLSLHGSPLGVLSVDRLFGEEVSLEEDLRLLSIIAALLGQFVGLVGQGQRAEPPPHPEGLRLNPEISEKPRNFLIVGQSPAILAVQQLLKMVAPGRAPVLLQGEAGTGKGLIARVLHELSPRSRYPFYRLNCASLPENLLAPELFGYKKAASPGGGKARPGRLEEADGGTIFLEEIGGLSLALQSRLGRFLHDLEFNRLGSGRSRKVDVRLITDTREDLAEAVKSGAFREDLYYLLSRTSVKVPPLRERRQDIPLLLDHFLDKVSKEYGRRFYLTQQALEFLQDYAWPGNVREMEDLVERLGIMVKGAEIGVKDLPAYLTSVNKRWQAADQAFLYRLKEIEKREILAALERNRWIQSQAAMDLGLTLRQIGYRVKQFGLEKLIKEHRGQLRSL